MTSGALARRWLSFRRLSELLLTSSSQILNVCSDKFDMSCSRRFLHFFFFILLQPAVNLERTICARLHGNSKIIFAIHRCPNLRIGTMSGIRFRRVYWSDMHDEAKCENVVANTRTTVGECMWKTYVDRPVEISVARIISRAGFTSTAALFGWEMWAAWERR